MGVFSWKTQDTHKSIAAVGNIGDKPVFTVFMHDDKGNIWREDNYEGYGEFGGKDFYELLAQMNELTDRDEGIRLAFSGKADVLYPNLTQSENWKWMDQAPEECEFQGYFYQDEEELLDDEY